MFSQAFKSKKVWLSGHTGFKGAWLAEWLLELGATVTGYALPPETTPSLFTELALAPRLDHLEADIRNAESVRNSLIAARPDFVFHLAAQPLVRRSYKQPVETYETNVLGTINVLEALRSLNHPCTGLMITTDKVYENFEHGLPFKEDDHLGGRDPYSSSKAMAEIAITAYRQSYFSNLESPVRIASARAGNVIGGGDWAEDRIVPDCIRSLQTGEPVSIRNPRATRPWQHVLEPLSGYLWLAAVLASDAEIPRTFNFGPDLESNRTVSDLVTAALSHWPGQWIDASNAHAVHEAKLLNLSINRAATALHWRPLWGFEDTVERTVSWYRAFHEGRVDAGNFTRAQIQAYSETARREGLQWAQSL
jgi:CDP-glucose 4,6-dehydratase